MARGPFEWIGDEIVAPLLGNGPDKQAQARRRRAEEVWEELRGTAPTASDLYYLEPYIEESFIDGGRSEYDRHWRDDYGSLAAQQQALQQMQEISRQGGYTALERDQIAQAQRQANLNEARQRAGIEQQMAMRGVGGSGLDMAARLQAQQAASNQGRADATNIAAQAQQRALMAMQAASQQASQLRGQNMAIQQTRNDAIDRFNQANTQARRDVSARNTAHQRLTASANAGAGARAAQQAWSNQAQAGAGLAGQQTTTANALDAQRARQAQQMNQLISMAGAYGQAIAAANSASGGGGASSGSA